MNHTGYFLKYFLYFVQYGMCSIFFKELIIVSESIIISHN